MVESGHCIEAIVAFSAGWAEKRRVLSHERRRDFAVAGGAIGRRQRIATRDMTATAGEGVAVEVDLMLHKAEGGQLVVKCRRRDGCQRGTGAAVICVAEDTFSGLDKMPMQARTPSALAGHVLVALFATRRIDTTPWGVASFAIRLKLGVALKCTLRIRGERWDLRRSQPAWTKGQTATQPHCQADPQCEQKGDQATESGEERV